MEYKDKRDEMKKGFSDAFRQIEETAEKAFLEIEQKSQQASQEIISSSKKISDFQAEYDALINQKKIKDLTDYENKRLRILENSIALYKNLRNMEFDDIKAKLALGEISNEEYYSALAILRDKYFSEGSKKWNQYTIEIAKYNQSVVEEQQKQIEQMLGGIEEKYSKSYQNILDKQNAVKEKLDEGLGLYETVHFEMGDGKESEWLRLSNIDEDLQILKNYNNALISAKEKVNAIFDGMGMDEDKASQMKAHFFEQITDLSIGKGMAFANHISFQPNDELSEYIRKWVEKIDLTEAISKNLYADESKELISGYASEMSDVFTETLNEKFGIIPDTFFTNGKKSAIEFKNGFISVIGEALSTIELELGNKISALMPDLNILTSGNNVTNNSNYNIYGADSPSQTALEIYKQEEKKKMLIGG